MMEIIRIFAKFLSIVITIERISNLHKNLRVTGVGGLSLCYLKFRFREERNSMGIIMGDTITTDRVIFSTG